MEQLSIPFNESNIVTTFKTDSLVHFFDAGTVIVIKNQVPTFFDADCVLNVASFAFANQYNHDVESINFKNLTSGEIKSLAIIFESM
jgi:hypothetical protein